MQNAIQHSFSILASTPQRWLELTRNLPADLLSLSPKSGEWSAVECLLHLIDTERGVFPGRVKAILAGEDFPAFNPDVQGSRFSPSTDCAMLAIEFNQLRQSSLELLNTLTPSDLTRTARHAELGVVTLSQLMHEWAAHDLDHTIQAERALMQPFIQGCGPWQVFFKANTIS